MLEAAKLLRIRGLTETGANTAQNQGVIEDLEEEEEEEEMSVPMPESEFKKTCLDNILGLSRSEGETRRRRKRKREDGNALPMNAKHPNKVLIELCQITVYRSLCFIY